MTYNQDYGTLISLHYEDVFKNKGLLRRWTQGPTWELPDGFGILEFAPSEKRQVWTYATVCMSQPCDSQKLELHMFSKVQSESIIELLTVTAHYHRTGNELNLGHTVNFGQPWVSGSICEYGLVSLPYLDGPSLENYDISKDISVRFLWLIPITWAELEYKRQFGLNALEELFEKSRFDYSDPYRQSALQ